MSYSLVCIKCKKNFLTEDTAAEDGFEFCNDCKAKNKEIADKIDAQIAAKRAKEPVGLTQLQEIRTNPRKKNKRTVQYMNVPQSNG